MTNKLLSDEELEVNVVLTLEKLQDLTVKHAQGAPGGNRRLALMKVKSDIKNLINSQKRLYAESVIGEDENNPAPREPCGASYRNQLRAEQRARINQ